MERELSSHLEQNTGSSSQNETRKKKIQQEKKRKREEDKEEEDISEEEINIEDGEKVFTSTKTALSRSSSRNAIYKRYANVIINIHDDRMNVMV